MTYFTETSHDDTFFFNADYSFPGSWNWEVEYLFGKNDSDGKPLFFAQEGMELDTVVSGSAGK